MNNFDRAKKNSAWLILILQLGDNCIQNCHLWRYIVGYTVEI